MRRPARTILLLAAALVMLAHAASPAAADVTPPPIGHVFIIVLENESAATTFGPNSPAPYLARTLPAQGAYLPNYYGIAHHSNPNYIAMISGQAPNLFNQQDCLTFLPFPPYSVSAYGQQNGIGCVYPLEIQTIANQLDAAGMTWRDYNESMGADPAREAATCGHPGIGAIDGTQLQSKTDQYATRHNPFVYFKSIIDLPTLCASHVVNLDKLPADLKSAATTPNYAFITPGLCSDGHDATCQSGNGKGGLAGADAFLQQWVPQITHSPAFRRQNGLLIITFDEAATSDTSACCGEIAGPGSLSPGLRGVGGGGGDVGAVLVSPCIAPGTVSKTPYNHYSMLRSVEDIFGLGYLGYAGLPGSVPFGSDVYTRQCDALPRARITARVHGRRIRLRWSATARNGPAVATFTVQVKRGSALWRTLHGLSATTRRSTTLHGRAGSRYRFRVRATDALGRPGKYATTRKFKLRRHLRSNHSLK